MSKNNRKLEDGFREGGQVRQKTKMTKHKTLRNINRDDAMYIAESDEEFQPYTEKFRRR